MIYIIIHITLNNNFMFWVCLKVWKQPLSHPELIIRFKSSVSQMAIWEHNQFSSTLCAVILSDTGSCRYACWCITLFWKHMLYCYVGTFRCFDTIIEQHEQVFRSFVQMIELLTRQSPSWHVISLQLRAANSSGNPGDRGDQFSSSVYVCMYILCMLLCFWN